MASAAEPDTIQRILFIASQVHVYNIPPPTASYKGVAHMAASWTADPARHIFTCRLRVVEKSDFVDGDGEQKLRVDIIMEDPSSGQLFAAAPYTTKAAVEPAQDSSRFFALRVQDERGRKATLGIGFEERSEAFDFGVALQDAQKALELAGADDTVALSGGGRKSGEEVKRDYSLKEGETITVHLNGSKFGRRARQQQEAASTTGSGPFSLPPPPGGGISFPLPPGTVTSRDEQKKSARYFGFDDGPSGEFA